MDLPLVGKEGLHRSLALGLCFIKFAYLVFYLKNITICSGCVINKFSGFLLYLVGNFSFNSLIFILYSGGYLSYIVNLINCSRFSFRFWNINIQWRYSIVQLKVERPKRPKKWSPAHVGQENIVYFHNDFANSNLLLAVL